MPPTRREELRATTLREIKEVAHRQMAEVGAAGISLRAIAREMRIAAPGLYRYFSSRDDLITALIVDAYMSLADSIEAAQNRFGSDQPAERFRAAAIAHRSWALSHSTQYSLIFGSPIPGYSAPATQTRPAALRTVRPFAELMSAVVSRGVLPKGALEIPLSAKLERDMAQWGASQGVVLPAQVLYFGFTKWMQLQGAVVLELLGHLAHFPGDLEVLYLAEIASILAEVGLPPSS